MKKASVLICDDEAGVRESLRMILEEGYALTYATNGKEAIEQVKLISPDLVILDIKMPEMDGLVALRKIKQIDPNVRVLVVTGYESSDVAAHAIKLGADDYLTKPVDREQVHAQIQKLLGLG